MTRSGARLVSAALFALALAATGAVAYFYVFKEMNIVALGAAGLLVFVICFFNVKASLVLLVFSMVLSPEIGIGQTSERAITIRLDDILLSVVTVSWLVRIAVFKDIGLMLKNPLNRPILVFSALAILSTALGGAYGTLSPLAGFFFVLKLIEYFFFFSMVVNFVRDEKDVNFFLSTVLIVCGVICVYGLYQIATGGDIAAPFEGSEGEKNTLAGYLVLVGSVAAGIAFNTESAGERTAMLLLLGGLLTVLTLSLSRGSWVASIVAVIVLYLTAKQKPLYLIVLFLIAVALPFVVPEVVTERVAHTFARRAAEAHRQISIGPITFDTSLSVRLFDYLSVLRRLPEHPILGFGVTGFHFLDGQFFRVLIEMGVVGLAAFIWLLVRLHNAIVDAIRVGLSPRLYGMCIGFYAGFWAMMAHSLAANTFIIVRIAEPFWFLAGLTVACALHGGEGKDWQAEQEPASLEYIPSSQLPRPLDRLA